MRKFLEGESFHRIPLKKLKTGHYKMDARLNGIRGSFILDTGASSSCVDVAGIEYFNLTSEDSDVKAAGAGATNMETFAAHGNSFKLGSKKVSDMSFVVFDLQHVNEALEQVEEDHIQGIIGADFLKSHRAVIDYGRNALYLK